MLTLHFHVTGLVQGVWFRGWAQMTALSLGLVGWVKNEPDGSVRGAAQAPPGVPPQALESFRLALRQGPESARVDSLEAEIVEGAELFSGFHVLR